MPAQNEKHHWTDLKPDQIDAFYAYLDTLPEHERPLYGIYGTKSSLWQQLGGGGKHLSATIYRDRINVSTYRMTGSKKLSSTERPVSDIAEIKVVNGPLQSSVELRFRDGLKFKVGDIAHKEAAPMARFTGEGVSAFDRSRLTPAEITWFALSCAFKGELPKGLLKHAHAAS